MDTIGERIRLVRTEKGVSRKALAKATRIAYTTLSDLELGRSKSTTALHRVASELGVSAPWLETGKGAKEPENRDNSGHSQAQAPLAADSFGELRAALALTAQALSESIPTAGRALAEALAGLPGDLRDRPYIQGLLGTIRAELAAQDSVRAPTRPRQGSAGRKRP